MPPAHAVSSVSCACASETLTKSSPSPPPPKPSSVSVTPVVPISRVFIARSVAGGRVHGVRGGRVALREVEDLGHGVHVAIGRHVGQADALVGAADVDGVALLA